MPEMLSWRQATCTALGLPATPSSVCAVTTLESGPHSRVKPLHAATAKV